MHILINSYLFPKKYDKLKKIAYTKGDNLELKEFGPYFELPSTHNLNSWLSLDKMIDGRPLTRREKELITALRSFRLKSASDDSIPKHIPASDIVKYFASKLEIIEQSNINTFKLHIRQTAPRLEKKKIFERKHQATSGAGRGTFLYVMQDPDQVMKIIDTEINEQTTMFSSEQLQEKKDQYKRLQSSYKNRDDVLLVKNSDNSEPWTTKLFGVLLDKCCRENAKDSRNSITNHVLIGGERVEITSEAPDGGLMIKSDARYLTSMITLNMQRVLETGNTKNRYAVDIDDVIRNCGHSKPSGGHRISAWKAIDRFRKTKWAIKFDPEGVLAKEFSNARGGAQRDTIYIDLMTNVETGVDRGEGAQRTTENKVPRFIEYSLGDWVFGGIMTNQEGLIVHPGMLTETNGNVMSVYYWLRRTLSPNQALKLTSYELYDEIGSNTPYKHFNESITNGLLKHAGGQKYKDLVIGDNIELMLFDYKINCRVLEPDPKKHKAKHSIVWEFMAPSILRASKLTTKRNEELRKINKERDLPHQGRLL